MKLSSRLHLITAFLVLAMPLLFIAGNAQAAAPWLLDDGAKLKDNGQWQVIDPGVCWSNSAYNPGCTPVAPSTTCRATCNAQVFWTNAQPPTDPYGTQANCLGNSGNSFCTDGTSGNQTACNTAGYVWTTQRLWQVSRCVGNYTSTRLYGSTSGDPTLNESNYQQCLHCHNDSYGTHNLASFGNGSSQETYFRTGHKNALRKVTPSSISGSIPLGGPFYTAGDTSTNWTDINWSTSPATQSTNSVYYTYMNWFSSIKGNQINGTPFASLADPLTGARTILQSYTNSGCLYCHTAGYGSLDTLGCTNPSYQTITTCTNNGGSWTSPVSPTEARYPLSSEASGATYKFEIGITCVACHKDANYATEHHTSTSSPTAGYSYQNWPGWEESTALCAKCHRMEDQNPISDLAIKEEALMIEQLADPHGNFTAQFLQSPHARFSGTFDQIGDYRKYTSNFAVSANGCTNTTDPVYKTLATCTAAGGSWSAVNHNEGCTGCHNVHVGGVDPDVLDPTNPLVAMESLCLDCHTNSQTNAVDSSTIPAIVVADINHPAGNAQAPLSGSASNEKEVQMACVRCHMGNKVGHFFKINTSASYDTFTSLCTGYPEYETRTTCTNAGQTWTDMSIEFVPIDAASTSSFAQMSVTWACGWCHYDPAKVGAGLVFNKAQLSAAAVGMHTNTGNCSTSNATCLTCHTTIVPGTNHHGVHSTCVQCHTTSGSGCNNHAGAVVPDKHSNTFCLTCHTNTGSHGNHHSVPGLPAECVSCHTIPGVTVPPMTTSDQVVAGCTSCHTDKIASGTGDNHHRGHGPSDPPLDGNSCQGCHSNNGGKMPSQVSTDKALLGAAHQDAGPEGTITATSKLCVICHSETDTGQGNFIQSGPNQNHHKGNCATCHHADGLHTDGAPGAGITTPPVETVVNCTTACHATKKSPNKHSVVACLTCHEHPGAGVLPLKIQDACGQCHGGGTNSGANPPQAGVPYITEATLTSLAVTMHAGQPAVSCNLVPDSTVLHRGDTLGVQISATNHADTAISFLFASFVTLPGGNRYPASGWLDGPISVALGGNASKSGHKSHLIPMSAPLGTYTYHGYVGLVGNLWSECTFNFEVQ